MCKSQLHSYLKHFFVPRIDVQKTHIALCFPVKMLVYDLIFYPAKYLRAVTAGSLAVGIV